MEDEYHLSEEQRIQAELEKEKKRKRGIKAVKWLLISIVGFRNRNLRHPNGKDLRLWNGAEPKSVKEAGCSVN